MEREKRKREEDGGSNGGRRARAREEDGAAVEGAVPADEEVEEFFAILKRIQVAVKYFEERNGNARRGGDAEVTAAAPRWRPAFEREDFDGVKTEVESSEGSRSVGFDLNSDPDRDVSDLAD